MVAAYLSRFNIVLFALCVSLPVVLCIDVGNLAQQSLQETFRRAFKSQLDLIENQIVGCLFDNDVCNSEDICFDDGLFGTCIAAYADESNFAYRLPPQLMRDLKAILATLVAQNYTWHDRYTQCCIRAALICGSMEIGIDLSVCEDFAKLRAAKIPETGDQRGGDSSAQDKLVKRFDKIWGEFKKRLDPLYQREFQQYVMDMPEKKLEELLDRHKYEYALDIPEKKLERTENAQDEFNDDFSAMDKQEKKLEPNEFNTERDLNVWREISQMFDAKQRQLPARMQELPVPMEEQEALSDADTNNAEDAGGDSSMGDDDLELPWTEPASQPHGELLQRREPLPETEQQLPREPLPETEQQLPREPLPESEQQLPREPLPETEQQLPRESLLRTQEKHHESLPRSRYPQQHDEPLQRTQLPRAQKQRRKLLAEHQRSNQLLKAPRQDKPEAPRATVEKRRQAADQTFIDAGYLWVQLRKPSSSNHSGISSFIERLNQVAGKRLLEDGFGYGSSGRDAFGNSTVSP